MHSPLSIYTQLFSLFYLASFWSGDNQIYNSRKFSTIKSCPLTFASCRASVVHPRNRDVPVYSMMYPLPPSTIRSIQKKNWFEVTGSISFFKRKDLKWLTTLFFICFRFPIIFIDFDNYYIFPRCTNPSVSVGRHPPFQIEFTIVGDIFYAKSLVVELTKNIDFKNLPNFLTKFL